MNFTPPNFESTLAFLAIVILVLTAGIAAVFRAYKTQEPSLARRKTFQFSLGLFIWLALTSLPAGTGFIRQGPPQLIMAFFMTVNLAGLAFAMSHLGRRVSLATPLWALVGFQAFRLPLEMVLHSWALQGSIPTSMTWDGQNWDVVSGGLCLLAAITMKLAPAFGRKFRIAWISNLVGFGLLINVGRVAIMSSPLPFAWPVDPPLLLAMHLPYAWIGSVCVAGALCGHVILTRALIAKP